VNASTYKCRVSDRKYEPTEATKLLMTRYWKYRTIRSNWITSSILDRYNRKTETNQNLLTKPLDCHVLVSLLIIIIELFNPLKNAITPKYKTSRLSTGKVAQRTKVLCSKVVSSAAILSLHQISKIFSIQAKQQSKI
jgi:hypothetical protein